MLWQRSLLLISCLLFLHAIAQNPPAARQQNELDEENDDNQNRQPGSNRLPPQAAKQSTSNNIQSKSLPLANTPECKVDVRKYCSKGSTNLIPNLKVLQCVDDLDDVSVAHSPVDSSFIRIF
jgi:hypothetical protein